MSAQEEDMRDIVGNKENSNLVSNTIASSAKSCSESIHKDLLLETLVLLQQRDIQSLSSHAVQKLIQCFLENNRRGIRSIIDVETHDEPFPHNSEVGEKLNDNDVVVVQPLLESHSSCHHQILEEAEVVVVPLEEENSWIHPKTEAAKLLLGPLNHKTGGTTGVVLELDESESTQSTTASSPCIEENIKKISRRADCLVHILSSSGTYPETSAHEAIAVDSSSSSVYETNESLSSNDQSADTDTSRTKFFCEAPELIDEAVDIGSLPRQGYSMMRFLCEHLLFLNGNNQRPPPPPPSPVYSKSLSFKFTYARLPELGENFEQNFIENDDEAGYTKLTFTKEEIEIIDQEYNWFMQFYSANEVRSEGDAETSGKSPQSEKLSGSLYTNMISTGDCNLSDDFLDHEYSFTADEYPRLNTNLSLNDHWIEGIRDDELAETDQGIEFFRLGNSHGDIFLGRSNDDSDDDQESRNLRYTNIIREKETSIDRSCIKPQDSVCCPDPERSVVPDREVFVEFNLPIVYKPYHTGLEPSPKLELFEDDIVAGRYRVASELGSAAFSVAYRRVDLLHEGVGNPNVCLKVIQNSKDFLDQSLDEIKVLQLLKSGKDGSLSSNLSAQDVCDRNHILHLRRYFYFKEHLILVTELLEENLYEFDCRIRQNENSPYFTMGRLSHITRQILLALQYVHSLGLIHSDVKPENIVMWSHRTAKVKLIDFGSACFTTDHLSSYVQSRSYRAPEVVLGLPYSSKIDLWSLGCVIAELFTGQVLFQNESIIEMLARIEATCGALPKEMVLAGRKSGDYYLTSGLLYKENVTEENGETVVLYDIYRPTRSNLAEKLGLNPSNRGEIETMFLNFLSRLLTLDPLNRPTAKEALCHEWIVWGLSLSEDDIMYCSTN